MLAASTPLELYDPGPQHRGLVAALRIRLRGELIERPTIEAGSREERLQRAHANLLAGTAAAWVETSTTGRMTVVVTGAKNGHRYVETVALDERPGFDRDRATALRIYEILTMPRPPARSPSPARRAEGWGLSVELGGLGSAGDRDSGLRGGLLASVGPHLETKRWRYELRTGAHFVTGFQKRSASGSVDVGEQTWSMGLWALARLDDIQLGPVFTMKLRILRAESTTTAGETADETLLVPALTTGVDLRAPVTKRLFVRMYLGIGVNLERRPLAPANVPNVDFGRWFGEAQVSLLISLF